LGSGADVKGAPQRPANPLALAIVARGANGAIFLARWGDSAPSAGGESVRLYVNSRRAEMFVRSGAKLVRCKPVGVSQSVRFDSFCDIDINDIPKDGQLTLIRRDQFDEQTQQFKLNSH